MRRMSSAPHRNVDRPDNITHPQGNPKIWVQLGEEARNTNLTILETVQELKNKMARLREDNARLTMEQERILKSLSDKQNQHQPNPNPEQTCVSEEQGYHTDQEETEGRAEV